MKGTGYSDNLKAVPAAPGRFRSWPAPVLVAMLGVNSTQRGERGPAFLGDGVESGRDQPWPASEVVVHDRPPVNLSSRIIYGNR